MWVQEPATKKLSSILEEKVNGGQETNSVSGAKGKQGNSSASPSFQTVVLQSKVPDSGTKMAPRPQSPIEKFDDILLASERNEV